MKQIATFLICTLGLAAADNKPPRELPEDVRPVVDLARSAAPEMFAAVVARLVETGKIPLREQQIELLEDAFAAAGRATEANRLVAIPATPPDTRALYRSKAGELKWDALSLQSRIVKDLLSIDRPKARELFDHIPRPTLEPRPCEDPLVADVSAYYEVAGAMAQSGFTAVEREKEIQVQFLATALAGARSPGELAPFARAMRSVDLTPPQRLLLSSALAAKLQSISADYRAFAMSFAELAAAAPDVPLTEYKRAQLSAPRCQPDFPTLADDETPPSKRDTAFKAEPYFQADDAKRIGDQMNRLRALPATSTDWRNQLADFLRDFAAWTPQGSALDVFHQRATVFRALLEFVPRGDDRDQVISLAVAFLVSSGAESQSPAEWLYQVRMLMDGAGQDASKMRDAFRASGSIGLTLYAALDGTF